MSKGSDLSYGEKVAKGNNLWMQIFETQETPGILTLHSHFTPLSELKDILYTDGKEFAVDANRRPALKLLLNSPDSTTELNTYLKSHDKARGFLAEKFTSAGQEELTKIAQSALANPASLETLMAGKPVTLAAPTSDKVTDRRQAEAVDILLTGLTDLKDATSVADIAALPNVKFGKDGKYTGGMPDAESIKNVEITINGQPRYFTQIGVVQPNAQSSLRASAWVEQGADGKKTLSFGFPGHGENVGDNDALDAVNDAKLNPQTTAAPAFVKAMVNQVGKANISAINVGGTSLGVSNAIASQLTLDGLGIPATTTFLMEPAAAPLAISKIGEALKDKNNPLTKELVKQTGLTAEQLAQKLNADNTTSISLRSFAKDSHGNIKYSNTAMMQPGAPKLVNAQIAAAGRIGKVDPNNEMVGERQFLDLTGQTNKSHTKAGQLDALHPAVNLASALLNGAGIKSANEIEPAKLAAAKEKSGEDLKTILKANPKFNEMMTAVINKAVSASEGTQENPESKEQQEQTAKFFTDLDKNPERIRPLAQKVETDEAFRTFLQTKLDAATPAGAKVDSTKLTAQFNTLMDLAAQNPAFLDSVVKDPSLFDKASALQDRATAFKAAHSELAPFMQGSKLTALSKELLATKDEQLTAVNDLLTHHPRLDKFLRDEMNNGNGNNKYMAGLMAQLVQEPASIRQLDEALTSDRAFEDNIISGKFGLGTAVAFFTNPKIAGLIKNPTLRALIAGSEGVQNNPMIKGAFDSGIADMMAAHGQQALQAAGDNTKQDALSMLASGYNKSGILGVVLALAAMFFSGGDSSSPITSIIKGLVNNNQPDQQAQPNPQQQVASR